MANRVFLILLVLCPTLSADEFHIQFKTQAVEDEFHGRIYLLFQEDPEKEPLYHFTGPHPLYATETRTFSASETIIMDGATQGFEGPLRKLPVGNYSVRAVLDQSQQGRDFVFSSGNLYSSKLTVEWNPESKKVIKLLIEHRYEKGPFVESEFMKEIRFRSSILSRFHHRDIFIEATVILPPSYHQSTESSYPSVYVQPGWGTTHEAVTHGSHQQNRYGMSGYGREKVFIFLNHETRFGYHCFTNSANNGPWGEALVNELIPHVEREFRIHTEPTARFLMGQSSGAWGVLWLMLEYPNSFGGVFACSPDFVDFRNFGEDRNLYDSSTNMLFDDNGIPRPGKRGADREAFIGDGTQLQSFEAVFGPKGKDGRPAPLYNRLTGEIDQRVLQHWKNYDLSQKLAALWRTNPAHLQNRIFLFFAENDDYGLDESGKLLRDRINGLGGSLNLILYSEGGHDVWTDATRSRIHNQIETLLEP